MEEDILKKKEISELDNKSNNKSKIIIILSIIILLIVGIVIYFVFIKENGNSTNDQGSINNGGNETQNDNKDKNYNENNDMIKYTADDGKYIELKLIDSDYYHHVRQNTYKMIVDKKEYTAYGDYSYSNNHLTIYTDNSFYLLEKSSKKIMAYYESDQNVSFNNIFQDDNESITKWYSVTLDGDGDNYAMIANTKIGKVIEFNTSNKPLDVNVYSEKLYLEYKDRIEQYSEDGNKTKQLLYNEIVSFSYGFARRGNEFYVIDFSNFTEKKVEGETYKGDKGDLTLFRWSYKSDDSIEYANFVYYDKKVFYVYVDFDDEIYATMGGNTQPMQNFEYQFLINRKTHTIIKYDYARFIKTKQGYYFIDLAHAGECVMECGPETVYTSAWKELGTAMGYDNLTDDEGNIYVNVDNVIVKYDIDGKELSRSTKFTNVGNGAVYKNIFYVVIGEDDNYNYLFNYSDNSKIKLGKVGESTGWPWIDTSIEINDNELTISTTGGFYSFDPVTKKVEEIKEEE